MENVLIFTPSNVGNAQKNLEEFIKYCRYELTALGDDLNWESNRWPQVSIFFGNWDAPRRRYTSNYALTQPLLDFAKAYVRYEMRFKKRPRVRYEVAAFKCLEKALLEQSGFSDILALTPSVLDRATELSREKYKPSNVYRIGGILQRLTEFVSENNIIPNYISWKNPNPKINDSVRIGAKAQKNREKKLPSENALNALAEIFASNPQNSNDIFTTSVCALLLCVPSRVSEVLALHVDCEVFDKKRDGIEAYGLRFKPGKGAAPQIKWVPTPMVSIAKEAIKRVREITHEARKIAKWHEINPEKFYRHSDCPDVAEDVGLTIAQRNQAFGFYNARAVKLVKPTFSDLQKFVMKEQPKGFPYFDEYRGIKFSEALFCFQRNQLSKTRSMSKVHVYRPVATTLNERISRYGVVENIFDYYGYTNQDGSPIKLTSHQFRHLLNTMAQKGGMSQFEIARWSGRADMKQNRVYDHMTEFELVEMLRNRDESLTLDVSFEELRKQIVLKLPMEREAFNILSIPTAHITEIGFCIHDYTMSPCQKHLDCFNCSEQVCIKGDKRLKNVEEIYRINKDLLDKMEKDIAEEQAGADRWYERTKMIVERAENLLQILLDPKVADGTVIRVHNPNEFTPLKRAMQNRAIRSDENNHILELTRNFTEET